MSIAICPGSFDPITVGHVDIIERAAKVFDEVIVCVALNSSKNYMFTPTERLCMVQKAIEYIPNAKAFSWAGLTTEFAKMFKANTIVKGVRNGTDFDWEYQLAHINADIKPDLDTFIIPSKSEHAHISSTAVRDFLKHGELPISYVPNEIIDVLNGKVVK